MPWICLVVVVAGVLSTWRGVDGLAVSLRPVWLSPSVRRGRLAAVGVSVKLSGRGSASVRVGGSVARDGPVACAGPHVGCSHRRVSFPDRRRGVGLRSNAMFPLGPDAGLYANVGKKREVAG